MNVILSFIVLTVVFLTSNPSLSLAKNNSIAVDDEYSKLSAVAPDISHKALHYALNAYKQAANYSNVKKPILTVIDYSLPSNKQRMWVFDLVSNKLLYNTYVAHGKNSGINVANHFSNINESKETSLGTFITQEPYIGSKGYSLNLQGLEKGYNNHAYDRRIVMHGAWYMDESFIKQSGRAGRSWGCPAIAPQMVKPVINTIKGGSVIFAYYPDNNYLAHSTFV